MEMALKIMRLFKKQNMLGSLSLPSGFWTFKMHLLYIFNFFFLVIMAKFNFKNESWNTHAVPSFQNLKG